MRRRLFVFFVALVLSGAWTTLPVEAKHASPHCWCYKEGERCEQHSWLNDKDGEKFTCTHDQNDIAACDNYCKKKEGWRAIYCDNTGTNYQAVDRRCAAAMAGRTSETSLVNSNDPRAKIPLDLNIAIGGKSSVIDLADYIARAYRYAIGIVAIVAIVMLVYGGFRYLLGSAMGDVSKAKTIIKDALIGMVIVLGAYTILKTVNPNTLTLKVPHLTEISGKAVNVAQGVNQPCKYDDECGFKGACLWYEEGNGICADGEIGSECVSRWNDKADVKSLKEYAADKTGTRSLTYNNNSRNYIDCNAQTSFCMFDRWKDFGQDAWPRCIEKSKYLAPANAQMKESQAGVGSPCNDDASCIARGAKACIMLTKDSGRCSDGSEGALCFCNFQGKQNESGCANANTKTNNGGYFQLSCQPGLKCLLTKPGYGISVDSSLTRRIQIEYPVLDGEWTCQKAGN